MPNPMLARSQRFSCRPAIASRSGEHTYEDLAVASSHVAAALLNGATDLEEARVAFLLPPGFAWAAVQWGIWRAGGVAVPLCLVHPRDELEYVARDSGAQQLVAHPDFRDRLGPVARNLGLELRGTGELLRGTPSSRLEGEMSPAGNIAPDRRAMIIYTSGTTGKPKGVVTTHAGVQAQIETLAEAWGWSPDDRALLVLPLHHVHGIINVLSCALWSGACCEVPPCLAPEEIWKAIESGRITVFMAVPTVYFRLIAAWDDAHPKRRKSWAKAASGLRLMVSGSAALPVPVLEKWREITGQTLLERYGMTEIGMALSNPLVGERRAGFVGQPLPGVGVRLVDEDGAAIGEGRPGEIEVRGPSVFREYWRQPEATELAFRGEWFRTGDVAMVEEGAYRILGRSSVDIIKTGGYKVSALEIEEVLRSHAAIEDCAVVGVADPEWGERVAAAVVLCAGESLDLEHLRAWGKQRLAVYKVPSRLEVLEELPRNPLGKVTKPKLVEYFLSRSAEDESR